jgi:hypothetical protein
VLNRVGGEVDDADVIAVDESALWQRSMELLEELPEPTSFSHDAILSLDTWSGDDVLTLRGLGDEVIVEEHNVAWGGPACIRATRPICICVDHQLRGGGRASQVEAEIQGAS